MERIEKDAFLAHSKLKRFSKRVEEAKRIIREGIAIAPAYVGISWGKDSVVLLHLAHQIDPDIKAISICTPQQELLHDFDNIKNQFLAKYKVNYEEIQIDLETLIPQAIQSLILWERYPVAITGVRGEENPKKRGSVIRNSGLLSQYQSGKRKGTWRCWPLGNWSWQDIWAYIVIHDLPYLSAYDKIMDRKYSRTTNVMPFTRGSNAHRKGRIQELRITSPEAYSFLQKNYPELC